MFQFRWFPSYTYFIHHRLSEYCSDGFPHSDIRGSMLICSSPRLFAAYHVLRRLLMPRHSPCALIRLTSSQLASLLGLLLQTFAFTGGCSSFAKGALRWRLLRVRVFCPSLRAFDFQCLAIPRTISRSPQRLNYVSKFSVLLLPVTLCASYALAFFLKKPVFLLFPLFNFQPTFNHLNG